MSTSITSLDQHRIRQERWRHHSAKEREALADLQLAINRYLAQASPGNINNAAFADAALPHLEKIKQVFATAKPRRLSQLQRTLEMTANSVDPKEKNPLRDFCLACPTELVAAAMSARVPPEQFEILKAAEESEREIIARLVGKKIARKRR